MSNKRNVIITGSGAVLPWGAPDTETITNNLKKDKVFVNDKNKTIGDYLYGLLKKNHYYKTTKPNFETLLNFIETIYQSKLSKQANSYSNFDFTDYYKLNVLIKQELSSFELHNPNIKRNINPSGLLDTAFDKNRLVLNEWFYYELYLHYIFTIIEQIKKYDDITNIEKKEYVQLNKNFKNFIDTLKMNGIARYYTLNYDYLPNKILSSELFDGYYSNGQLNTNKIINSQDINCYYHLHGSHELNLIGEKSTDHRVSKPAFDFKGNNLIYSNIITGYNKLDRINSKSFRHFNNQLLLDCYKADVLYIIGYSFGDTHINNAINCAMQKRNTKIICIDYINFSEEDANAMFEQKYYRTKPTKDYKLPKINSGQYSYFNKNHEFHIQGFKTYLKDFYS